jgi:hypothetical protein
MALVAFAAIAGVFHHLFMGADRVSEEDEENADRLVEERRER